MSGINLAGGLVALPVHPQIVSCNRRFERDQSGGEKPLFTTTQIIKNRMTRASDLERFEQFYAPNRVLCPTWIFIQYVSY